MEFVKAFDKLDVIVKLILTILFGWIIGGIYRLLKGRIIFGILWLIGGFFGIGWIIDIISIILHKKYTVFV